MLLIRTCSATTLQISGGRDDTADIADPPFCSVIAIADMVFFVLQSMDVESKVNNQSVYVC